MFYNTYKGCTYDKEDLIGKIIAHDAYYEGRDDALNGREKVIHSIPKNLTSEENNRKNYILSDYNGETYYLKLTQDQISLLNFLVRNQVDCTNGEITEVESQQWMEP
jgi:hypothetical protein